MSFRWRIVIALTLLAAGAMPSMAHDMAAWSDPARDQWYRSLKVPGSQTSCCDLSDRTVMNPDKVKQDSGGAWWVDLGEGFIQVPPERVVRVPVSIDGLPYIFLMVRMPGSPMGIRCFIPPVGTY